MKKKKKTVNKGPTDDQLFGNTDDIFGNVPEAKPKSTKIKKKKKKSGQSVGEATGDDATPVTASEISVSYVCVCVCVCCPGREVYNVHE